MESESVDSMLEQAREAARKKAEEAREKNIVAYAYCGPEAISAHIEELDEEPDSSLVAGAGAALLTLIGVAFSVTGNRRWLVLPAVASGLLLDHAFRKESLLSIVFERLGVRSRRDIERERTAMKALRGDFQDIPKLGKEALSDVQRLMESIEK